MRLIVSGVFSLEKYGKMWKNRPFFRADMAGLGKYSTGGYGRIGVYRVKIVVAGAKQTAMDVDTDEGGATDREAVEIRDSLKQQKKLHLEDKEARRGDDTKDTLQDMKRRYSMYIYLTYTAFRLMSAIVFDVKQDLSCLKTIVLIQ